MPGLCIGELVLNSSVVVIVDKRVFLNYEAGEPRLFVIWSWDAAMCIGRWLHVLLSFPSSPTGRVVGFSVSSLMVRHFWTGLGAR